MVRQMQQPGPSGLVWGTQDSQARALLHLPWYVAEEQASEAGGCKHGTSGYQRLQLRFHNADLQLRLMLLLSWL